MSYTAVPRGWCVGRHVNNAEAVGGFTLTAGILIVLSKLGYPAAEASDKGKLMLRRILATHEAVPTEVWKAPEAG